jgi:hypothetical protein
MIQFLLIFCSAICLLLVKPAYSQQSQEPNPPQSQTSRTPGLSFDSFAYSPQSRVTPGGVVTVRSTVSNSGEEVAIGYLVGHIDGQLGEEDRRRIQLAPGERKTFEVQLRLPKKLPEIAIEISMTLNVLEGDREIMVQNGGEPVVRTLRLPIGLERSITAVRMNKGPEEQVYWRWPPTKTHTTYEMVTASRVDASVSRQCLAFEHDPFPLRLSDWNCIDTFVIANPTTFDDAASIGMMQMFLQSGGRIWVMLDHIDTALVRELLGDDQQLETVDTVKMNRFQIDMIGQNYGIADRTIDTDEAVSMKRVIQQGGEVTHTVDGWPAVIWMPVSRGTLVFTTLDSSAWLQPRGKQLSANPAFQTAFTLPVWAATFARSIHEKKSIPPLNLEKTTYPIDRIGNPVVSRFFVAFVLLSFCACWIGMGFWRSMGGQVIRVGLIAPILALAASIPLIAASLLQRRDIPAMVSILQIVDMDSRGGSLVREAAAVYRSDVSEMELVGQGDGTAAPSNKIESGIRSITTDDLHHWRMTNPAWPAGTWRYWSELAFPEKTCVAKSRLSERGLLIDLPKAAGDLDDVVVAMVPGAPMIGKRIDEKRILVDGDLPAEGERWTSDTIVSDEQLRRASIYRELLENRESPGVPLRSLCGWSRLLSESPKWNSQLVQRGAALITTPVVIETPDVGTTIRVPYSLIRIENAKFQNSSVIFNPDTGRFIEESTLKAQADLAFLLPPEAAPLEVSSIEIDWDIRAPKRSARLSCSLAGEMVTLAELNEPSLPYKNFIRNPEVLKDMQDGRLELRIEILGGDALDLSQTGFVSWQIKHLRLTVNGRTLPRHQLVTAAAP